MFGKIEPGKTQDRDGAARLVRRRRPQARLARSPLPNDAKRACKIPMNAITRQDVVKVRFFAEGGDAARGRGAPAHGAEPCRAPCSPTPTRSSTTAPATATGSCSAAKAPPCTSRSRTWAPARSYETQANLRNLTGDGLLSARGSLRRSEHEARRRARGRVHLRRARRPDGQLREGRAQHRRTATCAWSPARR